MTLNKIVSKDEWASARRSLLSKEKEFTRLRDELSAEQRGLPWTKVDKKYVFDGPTGRSRFLICFRIAASFSSNTS